MEQANENALQSGIIRSVYDVVGSNSHDNSYPNSSKSGEVDEDDSNVMQSAYIQQDSSSSYPNSSKSMNSNVMQVSMIPNDVAEAKYYDKSSFYHSQMDDGPIEEKKNI
jgi:hypothetical protein